MTVDFFGLDSFMVGDRVKAFHPQTLGVMHWATVTKIGRKYLTVTWHVTGKSGRVLPKDVGSIDRDITTIPRDL